MFTKLLRISPRFNVKSLKEFIYILQMATISLLTVDCVAKLLGWGVCVGGGRIPLVKYAVIGKKLRFNT